MRNRIGLHQKYMADYEYRMMIADYEKLCGEVTKTKETESERKERLNRRSYKYDLEKAVDRLLNREKER